jgi:transposase-like protein
MNRRQTLDLEVAERRAIVFQMRKESKSVAEIAQHLGITTQAVLNDFKAVFEQMLPQEEMEDVRRLEAAKLDELRAAIYPKAVDGEYRAIDRFRQLSDTYYKLTGMNAPTQAVKLTEEHVMIVACALKLAMDRVMPNSPMLPELVRAFMGALESEIAKTADEPAWSSRDPGLRAIAAEATIREGPESN